jgi:hypothetical protein
VNPALKSKTRKNMHKTLTFDITPEQQGAYLTLPFTMPENIAEFRLSYSYPRFSEVPQDIPGGRYIQRDIINFVDLGLIGPDGRQVGASGSDKSSIFISGRDATPGYTPQPLTPGDWQILVGAYWVAPEGITVTYELEFIPKARKLLMGDTHTHTIGSDGVLSLEELAAHAHKQGLDFLAITDHNQTVSPKVLQRIPDITLIPGVEWTHYKGHANFLGLEQPYDEPFFVGDEDIRPRFRTAHDRGAVIIVNHPRDENCGFQFDLEGLPFDLLEVWNGPMREYNLHAIALWQSMLVKGYKIPAIGGSDYHRDNLFQILGGPSMGVYSLSNAPDDILAALKAGHSFITFAPRGPRLDMRVGEVEMGDTVPWSPGLEVSIKVDKLQRGDVVRVVTQADSTDLFQAPDDGDVTLSTPVSGPGFVRVELHRIFLPGVPPLPALISNPIFFS